MLTRLKNTSPNFLVGKESRVLFVKEGSTFKRMSRKNLYEGNYVQDPRVIQFPREI